MSLTSKMREKEKENPVQRDLQISKLTKLSHLSFRLFNIGLGRPSAIQEHEVEAPLPAILPDAEYAPWIGTSTKGTSVSLPNSHIISNSRATCQLFKVAAPALDEVYESSSFF